MAVALAIVALVVALVWLVLHLTKVDIDSQLMHYADSTPAATPAACSWCDGSCQCTRSSGLRSAQADHAERDYAKNHGGQHER